MQEAQIIDRTSDEYKQTNAIGIIRADGKHFSGTGFLVDKCHVLSNHHTVFDDNEAGHDGAVVKFSVGAPQSSDQKFLLNSIAGTIVAHGRFQHTTLSRNFDWTVTKLNPTTCKVENGQKKRYYAGDYVGFIPIYQMDLTKLKGQEIMSAGYPGDLTGNHQNPNLWGEKSCNITSMSAFGFVYHNCFNTPGDSGDPLLARSPKNGKLYAIAMNAGSNLGLDEETAKFFEGEDEGVNFASGKRYDVVSEGDKIKAAIETAPCE